MALELNGTTGVSLVQDGVVTAADLASGAITSGILPAGSVLQVVQGRSTTNTSINSTSYADTNLSASITPSSSSNKILIFATQENYHRVDNSIGFNAQYRILRDATVIETFTNMEYHRNGLGSFGNSLHRSRHPMYYLDSPSTTSAITYKTQASMSGLADNAELVVNEGGSPGIMILMEIAG